MLLAQLLQWTFFLQLLDYAEQAVWRHVVFFIFVPYPHLLQLFRIIVEHFFAVKLQKCFVSYRHFQSAQGGIVHFHFHFQVNCSFAQLQTGSFNKGFKWITLTVPRLFFPWQREFALFSHSVVREMYIQIETPFIMKILSITKLPKWILELNIHDILLILLYNTQ